LQAWTDANAPTMASKAKPTATASLTTTASLQEAKKSVGNAVDQLNEACQSEELVLTELESAVAKLQTYKGGSYWFSSWGSFVQMLKGFFKTGNKATKAKILADAKTEVETLTGKIERMRDDATSWSAEAKLLERQVASASKKAEKCLRKMEAALEKAGDLYTDDE
jgi:DNA repair exonuclease SbcCD ATPase subunit